MAPSSLRLEWRLRPGSDAGSVGSQTERRHLDFVLDGVSLYALVDAGRYDLVGLLGWAGPEVDREARDTLLLSRPGPLPSGRVALFICPECGGLGCGAVAARIELAGRRYTWSDFAFENDYDPHSVIGITVGPFTFEEEDYRAALGSPDAWAGA
jgi:hypothetical protein